LDCHDCGQTNPDGARFCNECGARLDGADRPAPIARDPISYTPRHLAQRILTLRSSLEGERKFVTILFADVVGSMVTAERLGPEAWHRVLDRYFRILGEPIHRLGGTINQFTGDGVMALFGAPIALEDHAQRACQAALEISESLRPLEAALREDHGVEFASRIGLNSGDVVVGKIGDDLRMDYTAQGHAVGLAARVERLAKPGTTCLTQHTAKLVDGYFDLSDLGDHSLHGSELPVRVYQLVGSGPLHTRLERAGQRGFSPFVGRDGAIQSLQHAMDEGGLVVGIEGAAGVGKSRLTFEFVERARSIGVPVFQAHCSSIGQSVPWLPILELLSDLFDLRSAGDDSAAAQRIAGDPIFARPEFAETLPTVLELLGLDGVESAEIPRQRAPAAAADRTAAVASLLPALVAARSGEAASIVLIDDLHWIDDESAVVLGAIVDAVATAQTLLLTNFRPDFRADWMKRSHYRQLGLAALEPETGRTLLDALIGSDASLDELRDRMLRDTGGNPLFIEELVRTMVETGRLAGEPAAYVLVDAAEAVEIPATLQPILAARIDRLAEPDKDSLQIASVIGRRFERSILEEVSELPREALEASLARLEVAQFIHCSQLHPNAPWMFNHAMIRDVAYHALLQERREQLHARVAIAVERSGEALGQRANLIAHHWDAANQPRRASRWRMRATLRVTHIQPRRHT